VPHVDRVGGRYARDRERRYRGKSTFSEESDGVPMIIAGPELPRGKVGDVPLSHADCAPAKLHAAGSAPLGPRSGQSLLEIANGAAPIAPGTVRGPRDRTIERWVHAAYRRTS